MVIARSVELRCVERNQGCGSVTMVVFHGRRANQALRYFPGGGCHLFQEQIWCLFSLETQSIDILMIRIVSHSGTGQQNNFFCATHTTQPPRMADAPITQHQPSPPPSPTIGVAPAPLPAPSTVDLDELEMDEVAVEVADCPWITSRTVNSVLNAELGHHVDLGAVARGTRDRAKVENKPLAPSFLGLEFKGLRYGRRVSRRERSSSNFPNQLSMTFQYARSHVHIMLFENGSLKIAGARAIQDARTILRDLLTLPNVCPPDCRHKTDQAPIVPRVSMFKRSYRLPMELKLEELAYALENDWNQRHWSATVEYGITRSTAVKLYLRDIAKHVTDCNRAGRCARNCTVSMGIFRTGFIMATGRTGSQLTDAINAFSDFLGMHYDDVVEHTAEDLFDTADDLEREDNTSV